MPQISLTDLVDVVSAAGTPKANKVGAIKNRGPYSPAFDYYKALREKIILVHQEHGAKLDLLNFPDAIADYKKVANYKLATAGYAKWWGKKSVSWFEPPRSVYGKHGVDVTVNPELGLEVDGARHLVKLYFKDEALAKLRTDLITVLMETALRPLCAHNEVMSILDVRRGRMISLGVSVAPVKAMVDAELAYVANLWNAL